MISSLYFAGGLVIKPSKFGIAGQTDNLVHEMGHALGLWHVFHGVTEMQCHDPCVETEASMVLGDLCSDTNPTPDNGECRDPDISREGCGNSVFENTPYRNYMGYAGKYFHITFDGIYVRNSRQFQFDCHRNSICASFRLNFRPDFFL